MQAQVLVSSSPRDIVPVDDSGLGMDAPPEGEKTLSGIGPSSVEISTVQERGW